MKYNTIIIGGGLAGLTAGATLSKFGRKVLLLEQHYKPGGCATTFKRGDFIIEVGLHEMSGLVENGSIPQIFDMLDVNKSVDLLKVPEFYAVVSGEEEFVFPHDFKAATKALTDKYPEDEKGIKRFFSNHSRCSKRSYQLAPYTMETKAGLPIHALVLPQPRGGYTTHRWILVGQKYFQ